MDAEKPNKKPPTPKKPKGLARGFLAKKKILEDLHHAPGIVGGIVEKGFSSSSSSSSSSEPRWNPSPTSFPQPSVVPFPVARHRSHGPHWGPGSTKPADDQEEVDEDKDEMDYDPVSAFASPVQRKEKKGLEFSSWREFVQNNGSPAPEPKKKQAKTTNGDKRKEGDLPGTASRSKEASPRSPVAARSAQKPDRNGMEPETSEPDGHGLPSLTDGIDAENHTRNIAEGNTELTGKMDSGMLDMLRKHGIDKLGSKVVEQKGERVLELEERGSQSSMDDIDAENLTRLKQMSPDEIAEAQAEITEKVDPAIVEMLKKRGKDKLRIKNASASGRDTRQKEMETNKPIEGGKGSNTMASVRDELPKDEANSNLWRSWSDRVERVRLLRFSLEGNVVDIDSTGNKPVDSQFNIENVAERDFLRTEGDPAAVGYTIKEAVALIRSLVPGQRTLALRLLASIFNKALHNLQKKDVEHVTGNANLQEPVDWQAVWAFALGPDPEMALSLRIALDDNHESVVLACAKAIQCILSYDINESFFNMNEKLPTHVKDICTAPVFRSRPEADGGFLHGGFWKYNTKASNILLCNDEDEDNAGNHTIQDDVVVAEQDVAAGLVRMGVLTRICYLLEMDPDPTLEGYLVSILIALARHSPTCANAIMRCPRLVQTVASMLTKPGTAEIHPSRIKAVVLLKVLSESDRQICLDFVNRGVFHGAMWQWYRNAYTLEHWIKSGREHCKFTSAMMVEQLRLWRVCIRYGYCITNFTDLFPAMCLWLNPPAFEKLIENDVLHEFASIAREAYLVLEALAQTLPILHSIEQLQKKATKYNDDNMETWSWSHVSPMVDIAINWLSLKSIPYLSMINGSLEGNANNGLDPSLSCMLWVISAVLGMLSSILDRITPGNFDGMHNTSSRLPWLPQFVPKIGLEISKNGFLNFLDPETKSDEFSTKCGSLVEGLCYLRHQNDHDASLASVSCLHGLVRLALLVDNSVQRTRNANSIQPLKVYRSEPADKILAEGITKWAQKDLLRVLSVFITFVSSEWHVAHSIEIFGRGGPAPGIGVGWGFPGGGLWSFSVLLARVDAQLIVNLLEIFVMFLEKDVAVVEGIKTLTEGCAEENVTMQRINSILRVCLIAGPGDRATLEKALDILFQAPVLKYLSLCTHYLLQCNKGLKPFDWQYEEEDYLLFGKILNSHFRNRWFSVKRKSPGKVDRDDQRHAVAKKGDALMTIHEDLEILETAVKDPDCNSLLTEWSHQRLPLPVHWFLSSVCSISDMRSTGMHTSFDNLDVAKAGLFFLLGLEAMSSLQCYGSQDSPISVVPLVWKLHALSMALHVTMDVLKEEKSREIFETLQALYGQQLDKLRCRDIDALIGKNKRPDFVDVSVNILNFQAQVYGSYTTFVEDFIEQFAAVSYGDILYGRQVTVYLHCTVDAAVRLATWNALSNAHVLELLPPLEKCLTEQDGYLEPIEHNEGILEAYVKSWTSGGLDRAAIRKSVTFTLAHHHLSCFIFSSNSYDKSALQTKLTKPLIRSYSRKKHQESMLLNLVRYKLPPSLESQLIESERRFELLKLACEGDSSLLATVEKLKASL